MVRGFELHDLAGEEVGSVCFVRNYVEFHFDGPILRSLANPVIEISGRRFEHPQAGSRDALCQLIGHSVQSARDETGRLFLVFDGDMTIIIPKAAEGKGPEVAHLIPAFADGSPDSVNMFIWENLIPTRGAADE
jgi:hypothetical protein